jgi:hypothetical protein
MGGISTSFKLGLLVAIDVNKKTGGRFAVFLLDYAPCKEGKGPQMLAMRTDETLGLGCFNRHHRAVSCGSSDTLKRGAKRGKKL